MGYLPVLAKTRWQEGEKKTFFLVEFEFWPKKCAHQSETC